MPHSAASDLVLHCLPMYYKKDTRLIWVDKGHLHVLLILSIPVNCSCWNILSVSYILSPISGFIKSLSLGGGL